MINADDDSKTPKRSEYLINGAPHMGEEEINEVVDTLRSGWLSTGPKTQKFEDDFKKYIGSPHAIALSSCTAGLHLCLLANEIGPGDEVIVSPMTFAATVNVIEHVGAKPVFVDIGPHDLNVDPEQIELAITKSTKAIMPVHFAGLPCHLDQIIAIAKKHGILVIEDAAHAVGSSYHGQKIGTHGDFVCFSFYVTKNLAMGEGGMVTTRNKQIAEKIRVMSLHGMDLGAWQRYQKAGKQHYEIHIPGFKYNMMDLTASIGIHQLKRLDEFIRLRKQIATRYQKAFSEIEELVMPPNATDDVSHAWHLYPLRLRLDKFNGNREDIVLALNEENIGTAVHYRAIHLHPYYLNKYQHQIGSFPNAEAVSETVFSIPIQPMLTESDVSDVISAVKRVIARSRTRVSA